MNQDIWKKLNSIHSSILAWKIPRTEEPGGLQTVGSQRVVHDSVTEHRTLHDYILLDICSLKKGVKEIQTEGTKWA